MNDVDSVSVGGDDESGKRLTKPATVHSSSEVLYPRQHRQSH